MTLRKKEVHDTIHQRIININTMLGELIDKHISQGTKVQQRHNLIKERRYLKLCCDLLNNVQIKDMAIGSPESHALLEWIENNNAIVTMDKEVAALHPTNEQL